MAKKQKILLIVGPTSSGKSALAVALAKKWNGEVISADARQVYRGLDIGTGKITKKEMKSVRHHLLDVASPKKTFTAHNYIEQARAAISGIASRGKLPIICGGTGFYIDALVGRIVLPDVPTNAKLRKQLDKKTAVQLFLLLKKKDPRRAAHIDRFNKRRLIRALEIATALGKNPSPRSASTYDALWLGITPPREELRKKITIRLFGRISRGMVAEARRLHAQGLSYKRMEELGLEYRYLARFLQDKLTRPQMLEQLEGAIWKYAKRQMTYWRRNKSIVWFAASEKRRMEKSIRSWIQEK